MTPIFATPNPHSSTVDFDPNRPLKTEEELATHLADLLLDAIQRQIWLFFLDEEQRMLSPIMPMDDHPLDPDELVEVDDLGSVPFSRVFLYRAREIAAAVGAASLVVVHERCGAARPSEEVLRWVRSLEREARAAGLPLRCQLLLHDAGVSMIPG